MVVRDGEVGRPASFYFINAIVPPLRVSLPE